VSGAPVAATTSVTLILSLITPTYVMQASDRRVIAHEDGVVVWHDDARNKALFVAERFIFAYTGVADVDGDTGGFLQARLASALGRGQSLDGAVSETGQMLADYLRALRPGAERRLALVGVGWSDEPRMALRVPLHVWTSNSMGPDGEWRADIGGEFKAHSKRLAAGMPFSLMISGVGLDETPRAQLYAQLAIHIGTSNDPEATAVILIDAIRAQAGRDDAVGRGVMVNTLPITPGPPQEIVLVAGPPRLDVRTFTYIPEGEYEGRLLGPLIVASNGSQIEDIVAEGPGILGPVGGTTGIVYRDPTAPPMRTGAIGQRINQYDFGRNDPCWCGSGKKYKKCHGAS